MKQSTEGQVDSVFYRERYHSTQHAGPAGSSQVGRLNDRLSVHCLMLWRTENAERTPGGLRTFLSGALGYPGPNQGKSEHRNYTQYFAGWSNAYGVVGKIRLVDFCMIVYCARAVALI